MDNGDYRSIYCVVITDNDCPLSSRDLEILNPDAYVLSKRVYSGQSAVQENSQVFLR